jgi:alpha-tubulin suppressor-like RCC1 family protein
MSNINKSSLATQIQTVINGLTVATETKQRLISLLKAAQNAGANPSTISTQLQTLITTVATSESLDEVAMLINGLALITSDRLLTVASVGDLPTTATPGTVYYVNDVDVPYIRRINGTWVIAPRFTQPVTPNAYAWGGNTDAQLGDSTAVSKSSPVSVVGGFADWVQVSSGGAHTLGVRANGTAWGWGRGFTGQLGDGTTIGKSSPVSVVGGFTDWVQVGAGYNHSIGLRANGTAWAWGYNDLGMLGNNSTVLRQSSPVSVVGGFTDWVQLSAGEDHNVGIRSNGTAWAWGAGNSGELGDGTTVAKSSPVSVVGGFTDWVQVSAGFIHSVGVRANGTAWAWGNGTNGRLGNFSSSNTSSPVSVVGGFTDWVQVSASSHTVGVRANGTAWAWGDNGQGQLGTTSPSNTSSPEAVVGGFTDWVQVSAGQVSSFGIRTNGTAWAWGAGLSGRLGDGTAVAKSSPVSIVGGFTDWLQIDAGQSHTAALRS